MVEREKGTWGQSKRFEFIEWRLFWLNRLNRRDIELEFGISTPQASVDLRNYQQLAPHNLQYDATLKSFVRSETFEPKVFRPSAERFLLQMRAMKTGAIQIEDTWFPSLPAIDVLPKLSREVSSDLVRKLYSAISQSKGLIITYRSLKKTSSRIIGPHALAYDGHRWHVRAWCFEKKVFRDFVLTRIGSASEVERVDFDPEMDLAWNSYVDLELCAHPDLEVEQRETIESDFGMKGGCITLTMRVALAYYFVKRNNLDIDILSPERQQFVLKNREALYSEMKAVEARAVSLVHSSKH